MQAGLNIFSQLIKINRNYFLPNYFLKRSSSSFGEKLFKAIEEHKLKIMETKDIKKQYKCRYNGRSKKRKWQNYSEEISEEIKEKKANFKPEDRIKKKKAVILLGYSGANYFGMQRNPGQITIEEELLKAMLKCKWIDEDGFNQPQQINFQRAARTDKGVSAARQICSIKLPVDLNLNQINSELPEVIRIFATKRVTKGFNAKDACNARTYSYTMPTISLEKEAARENFANFRVDLDKVEKFRETIKLYEGTKNFHNFTSRKEFLDPSSKRFIMSFDCFEPFLTEDGFEFITCCVKGQSFMIHQIRKMVGLALAIVRGNTTVETMNNAFNENRIDIPMAPGLGLVLDKVHYERYNEKYGSDGIHDTLTWDEEEPIIQEFVKKHIYPTIFKTEIKDTPMLNWVETLSLHTYDVRSEKNVDKINEKIESEEKCNENENKDSSKVAELVS